MHCCEANGAIFENKKRKKREQKRGWESGYSTSRNERVRKIMASWVERVRSRESGVRSSYRGGKYSWRVLLNYRASIPGKMPLNQASKLSLSRGSRQLYRPLFSSLVLFTATHIHLFIYIYTFTHTVVYSCLQWTVCSHSRRARARYIAKMQIRRRRVWESFGWNIVAK